MLSGFSPTPEEFVSFIGIGLVCFFVIGFLSQFVESITEKVSHGHFGGVLVSGLYLGYDIAPRAMIFRETFDLITIIDASSLLFILEFFSVLSIIEIIWGMLYVFDKRGKFGFLSTIIAMISGYLMLRIPEIGVILLSMGLLIFSYSEPTRF